MQIYTWTVSCVYQNKTENNSKNKKNVNNIMSIPEILENVVEVNGYCIYSWIYFNLFTL